MTYLWVCHVLTENRVAKKNDAWASYLPLFIFIYPHFRQPKIIFLGYIMLYISHWISIYWISYPMNSQFSMVTSPLLCLNQRYIPIFPSWIFMFNASPLVINDGKWSSTIYSCFFIESIFDLLDSPAMFDSAGTKSPVVVCNKIVVIYSSKLT